VYILCSQEHKVSDSEDTISERMRNMEEHFEKVTKWQIAVNRSDLVITTFRMIVHKIVFPVPLTFILQYILQK
jgi:hypothetical protein